jgi:alkylation response protein AidB-like acyl-CoA dehydrogenase
MRALGGAQRAFDLMCDRANTRMLSGKPLADKQLVQLMVYESYHDIQASRLLVLDAAAKLDAGGQARVELSSIKVACAQMHQRVVDRAVQVHGAYGLADENPLTRLGGRGLRIVDGPDEAHIERVARLVLREYREGGAGWDFGLR